MTHKKFVVAIISFEFSWNTALLFQLGLENYIKATDLNVKIATNIFSGIIFLKLLVSYCTTKHIFINFGTDNSFNNLIKNWAFDSFPILSIL